jgi:hypothetical protein
MGDLARKITDLYDLVNRTEDRDDINDFADNIDKVYSLCELLCDKLEDSIEHIHDNSSDMEYDIFIIEYDYGALKIEKNEVANYSLEIVGKGFQCYSYTKDIVSLLRTKPCSFGYSIRDNDVKKVAHMIRSTYELLKTAADKKTRTQERITQIIDNYHKTTKAQDSKVEKQADITSKEATSQAAKAAEKEAKVVKTFVESPQASGNIDAKTIQELKTAYSSGGMTGLYEKLGTLGETVQEKFLSFFAKYSDGNSLHSFASSFSNNKSIILSLYQYSNDPSLLAYLGESATRDLLSKGKIKMKDFLKYASPSAIALYISDLNKTGNQELLKQIFGLLNLSQTSYVKQHTSKPAPGGDDWMAQLQNNMSKASGFELSDGLAMGSDRAPMGRSYDKMKQRGPFYFSA